MAGNPSWKKGGESPNPNGRRKFKNSAQTIKGKIERFLKAKLTPAELNRIYNDLSSAGKKEMLTELLPYVTPRQTAASLDLTIDRMTDQEIQATYMQLFNQVHRKLAIDDLQDAEVVPIPELIQLSNPEKPKENDKSTDELESTA